MDLKNFRPFRRTGHLELAPLTLVFGKNSSGKTALLRGPLLLKQLVLAQTPVSEIPISGPEVDFGSYRELVWGGELRRDVELTFGFRFDSDRGFWPTMEGPESEVLASLTNEFALSAILHWNAPKSRAQFERISVGPLDGRSPVLVAERKGPNKVKVSVPPTGYSHLHVGVPDLSIAMLRFFPYFGRSIRIQQGRLEPEVTLSFVLDRLQEAARNVTHIGPLREMPERAYRIDAGGAAGTGRTVSVMTAQKTAAKSVSFALDKLGLASEVDLVNLAPGYVAIVLTDKASGRHINLADVGFGVSQVLPILVTLATARPRSLIVIEQPELHLHPETQGSVIDVLLSLAKERGVSLLVESHSEHVLLRLQRRVASGDLKPGEFAIYIVEKGKVSLVPVDQMGRLDASVLPKGFFEEEWTEAVKLARAASKQAGQ